MSILKKAMGAVGVGLSATDHYERAFTKGILLGPEQYPTAIGLFEAAAQQAAKEGNGLLEQQALANASLYNFVTTGDLGQLHALRGNLVNLQQIEKIGTRNEMMPAQPLVQEIDARLAEVNAERIPATDHAARAQAHRGVAEAFKPLFTSQLVTYGIHPDGLDADTAQARFFFHTGLSSWHEAISTIEADPDGAAQHMSKALNAFQQCNNPEWVQRSQDWLQRARLRRTCWICHREFQGWDTHFHHVPARLKPYVKTVVEKLGQDVSTIDEASGHVVVCVTCGSLLESAVDARLAAMEQRMGTTIVDLQNRLSAMEQRLRRAAAKVPALR